MIRDAVLVLTQAEDVTADVVVDKLAADGVPTVRWDSCTFPRQSRISGQWEDGRLAAVLCTADGDEVDLDSLRGVWYRRPREFAFADGMAPDTMQFARAEARQAFWGTVQATDAVWMNDPGREATAGLKPLQLRVAQTLGLEIPDTLVTNDPERARQFLDPVGEGFIYKRLSSSLLYTDDGRLTAFETERITPEMCEALDHVAVTPCLFQRYVDKRYEIRATVVDGRVFAARVDSQASEESAIDWRLGELPWEPYRLPESIESRIVALVRQLGLLFGAVDLIRRPDGSYVFLEINPSGQWAWFQDEITHPIRDAIVATLTAGPRRPLARLP